MIRAAAAVVLVLHGLVHLWYVVLSQGWVEVEDQMGWNGRSWLLSTRLGERTILSLASALYVLVTLGFVVGAIGYALRQGWASPLLLGAAVVSTVTILGLWDGEPTLLVEKGFVGVLINVVLVVYLMI